MKTCLLLFAHLVYSFAYGQNAGCKTDELYSYLKVRNLASEGDQEYIICKPVVQEPNGDGIYQFGINETDSFTHLYIYKDSQIRFLDASKIENVFVAISDYMYNSSLSLEEKVSCYEKVLKIIKDETLSYPWLLEEKN